MSSKRSVKSKQSKKSQKVKSRASKSRKSQKSRQSRKQSKRLKEEIALSKEMSKRISKRPPIIASSHGVSLLKRSKRNLSKGRPLKSARDFFLATSLLTAALSPYEPHHMAQRSKIAPDTQVHLDWHKGMFPEGELTSKQYKKLMKRSKRGKRLSTIQEGGMIKGTPITVYWPHDDGKTYPYTMTYWGQDKKGRYWATQGKTNYDITDYEWEVIKDRFEENKAVIPQLQKEVGKSRLENPPLLGVEYQTPFSGETATSKLDRSYTFATSGTGHLTNPKVAKKSIKSIKNQKGTGWSLKYKRKINCKRPKGFSQKQYCKRILKKKKKRRTKKNRKKRTKRTRRK